MIATLVELGYLNKTQAYKPIELPFRSMGTLFKGREEKLNQLHASLNGRDGVSATAIVGTAVHGLGGIGKTRLAVEYAWKYVDDYTALLFVVAESAQALRANLAALCGPTVLNLPEQDVQQEDVRVGAVLRWLQKNQGWLLILDNIDTDEAATEAEAFLAKLSAGNVVLTSRRSEWSGQVASLPLSPHVRVAVRFADQRDIPDPTSTLLGQLGYLADVKALYSEAESTRRRALEIDEQEHGVDSTQAAHSMSALAQTLDATDRRAEAEPLMRRAVTVVVASLGGDHPHSQQ